MALNTNDSKIKKNYEKFQKSNSTREPRLAKPFESKQSYKYRTLIIRLRSETVVRRKSDDVLFQATTQSRRELIRKNCFYFAFSHFTQQDMTQAHEIERLP